MALLTWNGKYSVGVEAMDNQHSRLFETLNELHSAMMKGQARAMTGPILSKLLDYTRDHFRSEESAMSAARYPGLQEHHAKHVALTSQVEEFAARHEKGDGMLSLELLNFLRDWLTHHIQQEDQKYGPWLNKTVLR